MKSCMIVPVHQAKFSRAFDLVKSYNLLFTSSDLFLVFTNEQECKAFRAHCNTVPGIRYKEIVCTEPLLSGVVTQKKYFGLSYVFANTGYEYAGVFDCDTLFTKNKDIDALFYNYYENVKTIYANVASHKDALRISSACLEPFSNEDRDAVLAMVPSNYYFWFNDLPVYKKQHFLEFLQYIKYSPRMISWYFFDYVSYGYFLLLRGYFTVHLLQSTADFSIVECKKSAVGHNRVLETIKPMWEARDGIPSNNVFLRLHVDR